jgi:hypothetical protein
MMQEDLWFLEKQCSQEPDPENHLNKQIKAWNERW